MFVRQSRRGIVTTVVTASAIALAPFLVTQQAMGQAENHLACTLSSSGGTNDTSACFKNANGDAACSGNIVTYFDVYKCNGSTIQDICQEKSYKSRNTSAI